MFQNLCQLYDDAHCHLSQTDMDNDLIGDPCDTNKDRYKLHWRSRHKKLSLQCCKMIILCVDLCVLFSQVTASLVQ